MKDLILNDVSRCNNYKCPINAFCARFRQLRIDSEKGDKVEVPVNHFDGDKKIGLCDHFINADVD